MSYVTKPFKLFPAGGVEAIRKAADMMEAERRERVLAQAGSHRFDLIGRDADAVQTSGQATKVEKLPRWR